MSSFELSRSGDYQNWLDRSAAVTYEGPYRPPIMFDHGLGCELWDVDGRRFLDFESGQFCMTTGHSHPSVTSAIRDQASRLMQIGNRFSNPQRVLLAERLVSILPDPLNKILFCSTGSEANEWAIRIAKIFTGRSEMIGIVRGYHGRTASSAALTSAFRRMRKGTGPDLPGNLLVSPPYEYRCPFECGSCNKKCWNQAIELIDRSTSGAPAAVILEPIMGAGGIIPVDSGWAQEVREFCDERGALLIVDEALSGLGRTGKWFAFEHAGIVPDIVVMAKALGGGVPTAAVAISDDIARVVTERGLTNSSSHLGDPFQCSVALANIDVTQEEGLLENAQEMGKVLREGLDAMVEKHPIVGQARGIGLLQGIEIVQEQAESHELASNITVECMNRGLIVGGLRPHIGGGNVLRFAPPLCVSQAEILEALEIADMAISTISSSESAAVTLV